MQLFILHIYIYIYIIYKALPIKHSEAVKHSQVADSIYVYLLCIVTMRLFYIFMYLVLQDVEVSKFEESKCYWLWFILWYIYAIIKSIVPSQLLPQGLCGNQRVFCKYIYIYIYIYIHVYLAIRRSSPLWSTANDPLKNETRLLLLWNGLLVTLHTLCLVKPVLIFIGEVQNP